MSEPKIKTVTYLESDLPKVVVSGPASTTTTFALHVAGPFGIKEARNILKQINLYIEFLEEEEATDASIEKV